MKEGVVNHSRKKEAGHKREQEHCERKMNRTIARVLAVSGQTLNLE